MKRSWLPILCLFCWLAVLLVPALRHSFFAHLRGDSFYGSWQYGGLPQITEQVLPSAENYADDAQVQAVVLEPHYEYTKVDKEVFDSLVKRFPDQTWLIARRLKSAALYLRHNRLPGEFSGGYNAAKKTAGWPPPERLGTKPNFTSDELEKYVALARHGQKLEPDNDYFDWMEIYFLLSSWRDDEAWRVLDRAAQKARFDSHERDWKQVQIAAHEKLWQRPLSWEEKLLIERRFDYPSTRAMGRIILWEIVKMRRRGDHKKALRNYDNVLRLMLRAKWNSPNPDVLSFFDAATYLFVNEEPLQPDKRPKAPAGPHHWEDFRRLQADAFVDYAKQHDESYDGRALQSALIADGQRSDALYRAYKNSSWDRGLRSSSLIWSVSLRCVASLILLQLPLLLVWWAALGALLRWLNLPPVVIARRDLWHSVAIFGGILTLCCLCALMQGAIWQSYLFIGLKDFSIDNSKRLLFMLPLAMSAVLPVLMSSGWCSIVTRNRLWRQTPFTQNREVRLFSLMHELASAFIVGALAWMWSVALSPEMRLISLQGIDAVPNWPPCVFQTAFGASLVLLWTRWLLRAETREKPLIAYRLCWLHTFVGQLIILGSIGYFVLLCAGVPLRKSASSEVEQLIQKGEVALMLQNSNS